MAIIMVRCCVGVHQTVKKLVFVVSVRRSWSRDSFVLPTSTSAADCGGGRHDNESRTVGGATGDHFFRINNTIYTATNEAI